MKINVTEKGFTTFEKPSDLPEHILQALYNLEDGISYLNYALLENDHGLCDPERDLQVAIGFLAEAVAALQNKQG